MRTFGWLAAAALAVSCGNKSNNDQPAPTPPPSGKTTTTPDKPAGSGAEPTKAAGSGSAAAAAGSAAGSASGDVTVTSKSPDAIKEFEKGRDLTDGERNFEAVEHFQKAIELDPDFALAHAYLGIVTPGPPGVAELDKAKTLSAKLPDAERLVIEGAAAQRAGKSADMVTAYTKVAELAPKDWRVHIALGWDAHEAGDDKKALEHFGKAAAIKADLPYAQDGLAYGHAGQREWDPAIAAAKKEVELLPKEPNPQDTLGEILLMAGKFDDAEKAFKAALDLDPLYLNAWQGIALARAYRGDWKGAFEANEAEDGSAADIYRSITAIEDSAWFALAADNLADAQARLDALEKDAEVQKTPEFAGVALTRAVILLEGEKFPDAAKWLATARKRGDALPTANKRLFDRDYAIAALRLGVLTKPIPDADKLVAALDDDAKSGDPAAVSYQQWAHGLAAWQKTGPKDAIADLSKCRPQLIACRYDLADAQRKNKDEAAAAATEKDIIALPQRDASAVYYITDSAKPPAPAPAPKKP